MLTRLEYLLNGERWKTSENEIDELLGWLKQHARLQPGVWLADGSYAVRTGDAKRLLTEQGLIGKRPSGVAVINPAFIVAQRCAALLQRYVGEFGMTPSARSTVRLPERPTADDLEQFINTSASDVG